MRIDRGPSLSEIRMSVIEGIIVEFANENGEQVRGKVVEAKPDQGVGRVALVLEEDQTGLIWFARYRYGRIECGAGDIATWKLRRCDIENLTNGDLWRKCAGESG